MASTLLHRLSPFFAVMTLPIGILAALFVGFPAAVGVFVIGWLLLVPATAVLFPPKMITGPGVSEDVDQMVEEQVRQSLGESGSAGEQFDPVEELRQRYARGEIDDQELERGLEALLETEGVDADDEAEIRQTIDRLADRSESGTAKTESGIGETESGLTDEGESDFLTEEG